MNSANSMSQWNLYGGAALLTALILGGATDGLAQESVAVRAPLVVGTLPADDPNAGAWNSAVPATFPMSPQVHWPDRIQEVTVKDVSVRALHDGTRVAVLLEYADPTEDPDDAAAIEFMVGGKKAHFAHGQPMLQVEGGPVNIWFWRNKENKAVDMTAKGFGTLKPQSHQDVSVKAAYSSGKWKVVFSRPLVTEHADEDAQIALGEFSSIAFAVWDGRKDGGGQLVEKGSQKAVSSWWYFRAEPPPDYSGYLYAAVAIVMALGFQFVLIRNLKKGQSA
jgi:DMSO reductase family type II enzyme heme b subunit